MCSLRTGQDQRRSKQPRWRDRQRKVPRYRQGFHCRGCHPRNRHNPYHFRIHICWLQVRRHRPDRGHPPCRLNRRSRSRSTPPVHIRQWQDCRRFADMLRPGCCRRAPQQCRSQCRNRRHSPFRHGSRGHLPPSGNQDCSRRGIPPAGQSRGRRSRHRRRCTRCRHHRPRCCR